MVYKQLIKFDSEENYKLAKEYLKNLIRDSEGSCVIADDRDHYESGNKQIIINLNNKGLEISAECLLTNDENFLEMKLNGFKSAKSRELKGAVIFDGLEIPNSAKGRGNY